MARFELNMIQIIDYIKNINFFDGKFENLQNFISSVDFLYKYSPKKFHQYILGVIINIKVSFEVKMSVFEDEDNWKDVKIKLSKHFDMTNFDKFLIHLVKTEVYEFQTLEEFLEDMTDSFYRYRLALQYSETTIEIDHRPLIENLTKQISGYVEFYMLSLVVQTKTYLDAIKTVQSKLNENKKVTYVNSKQIPNQNLKEFKRWRNYSDDEKFYNSCRNNCDNNYNQINNENLNFSSISNETKAYQEPKLDSNEKLNTNLVKRHSNGVTNSLIFHDDISSQINCQSEQNLQFTKCVPLHYSHDQQAKKVHVESNETQPKYESHFISNEIKKESTIKKKRKIKNPKNKTVSTNLSINGDFSFNHSLKKNNELKELNIDILDNNIDNNEKNEIKLNFCQSPNNDIEIRTRKEYLKKQNNGFNVKTSTNLRKLSLKNFLDFSIKDPQAVRPKIKFGSNLSVLEEIVVKINIEAKYDENLGKITNLIMAIIGNCIFYLILQPLKEIILIPKMSRYKQIIVHKFI